MRYDDKHKCQRCEASAHDVLESRDWWLTLECCFCGAKSRVRGRVETPAVPSGSVEFRFQTGRFTGMTLAEADRQNNGRKYLEFMAAKDERLAPVIKQYIAASQATA